MLVVADSSPLIALICIGRIDILPAIFRDVLIPPEVAAELGHAKCASVVQDFIAHPPTWLVERAPGSITQIPLLHAGEIAAISLAQEVRAELLLIDELRGRKAATDLGLAITGTIGVLEIAADRGLLDLREVFEALKKIDFWISHELLNERLRLRFKN